LNGVTQDGKIQSRDSYRGRPLVGLLARNVPVRLQTETLVIRGLQAKEAEKVIRLGANWRCKTLCTSRNGKFIAAGLVNDTVPERVGLAVVNCETGNVGIVAINAGTGGEPLLKNVTISEDGTLLACVGGKGRGWIAVANVKR
jgi:hypothetical protein